MCPRIIAACVTTYVFLGLVGCSFFGPVKTPPVKNYTLGTTSIAKKKPASPNQPVLLVSTPAANPGYESADMIYTQQLYQLNTFATHHWVAPPTELLLPLLVQSLQNTSCFQAVVTSPYTGAADVTLDTQLLVLRQEFVDTDNSRVRMAVQVTLTDNITRKIIAYRRLEAVVTAEQANPYAGVIATNRATTKLLGDVNGFACRYGKKIASDVAQVPNQK